MNTGAQLASEGRLRGRRLILARAAWVAVAAATLALDLISVPFYYTLSQAVCNQPHCPFAQLTPAQVPLLHGEGLTLAFWAAYSTAVTTAAMLVFCAVGLIIFWRKPDDRMALFGSLMLVTFGSSSALGTMGALSAAGPAWSLPVEVVNLTGQIGFFAFFCLFPNGRFVPRWTRWTTLYWAATWLARLVVPPSARLTGLIASTPIFLLFVASLVVAQVYRYRLVSNPRERQQTKWVVFGFVVGLSVFSLTIMLGLVLPASAHDMPILQLAATTIIDGGLVVVPVAIAVAILRSRLYDIDILINRTLIYGALTALLGLTYWGTVFLLQTALRPLTGGNNELAIVVSTLVIAGLFLPLRRRLQSFIDRRFYRRKYDAAKTLAAFSATLRDEVDLPTLSGRLVDVVDETMQPNHVSLWLREPWRNR